MQLSMHSDSFRSGGGREGEITARHTAYDYDYDYIMAPQRGRPYGANLGSMGRNTSGSAFRISSVRKVSGLLGPPHSNSQPSSSLLLAITQHTTLTNPVGVMLGCCTAQRAVQWSLLTQVYMLDISNKYTLVGTCCSWGLNLYVLGPTPEHAGWGYTCNLSVAGTPSSYYQLAQERISFGTHEGS